MPQARRKSNESGAHGYEFAGPPGALILTALLPPLCYAFAFACNDVSGCPAPSLLHPYTLTLARLKKEVAWPGFLGLLNTEALLATFGWYALSFVLYAILPAQNVKGTELRTGGQLTYRLNAWPSALVTLSILFIGTIVQGTQFPVWPFIWHNYIQLLTANILVAYGLAIFVYIRSFSVQHPRDPAKRELAAGGHTGNVLYDWFIGRELNPAVTIPFIGHVDLKSFMELRPGMLGWLVLDLAFAARQWHEHGLITASMIIVVFSQAVYILDALYMESAILTTIDITTDGFGFMLSFGDLVWVPFTYSLAARYLAVHPVQLGFFGCIFVLFVQASGYYIFRAANSQKNLFRTNPQDARVAHLTSISTKTGSRLLTSGWWGAARHINYMGDWLMSWSYVLPTGLAGYVIQPTRPLSRAPSEPNGALWGQQKTLVGGLEVVPGEAKGWGMIITYFFMIYFAVLLVHRERRDEDKCRRKYGKDWEKYCKAVPYRIIPYVY